MKKNKDDIFHHRYLTKNNRLNKDSTLEPDIENNIKIIILPKLIIWFIQETNVKSTYLKIVYIIMFDFWWILIFLNSYCT